MVSLVLSSGEVIRQVECDIANATFARYTRRH
jgi:hypothetical protein